MSQKPVKHSFKVFSEDLKVSAFKSVLLMYGEEQYLIKWAVDSLVKKFVSPATKAMDFVVLDEEDASCSNIIEACETFSMFSERRIVWVKNFPPLQSESSRGYPKSEVENLIEYVNQSNDRTILIFSCEKPSTSSVLADAVKKAGKSYNFTPIERKELESFAMKRFRAAGAQITSNALKLLISETGYFNKESSYRLYNFENDINKIIAISGGRTIQEGDIEEAVSGDMDTFVFDMLDGISGNQKDRAFQVLYNMLQSGVKAIKIVASIVSQFEFMLTIKQLREDGMNSKDMYKKLGGSEYRIKKMIPFTNKFSVGKIKEILSNAYEIQRNIKTGLLGEQLALEMFIASI